MICEGMRKKTGISVWYSLESKSYSVQFAINACGNEGVVDKSEARRRGSQETLQSAAAFAIFGVL